MCEAARETYDGSLRDSIPVRMYVAESASGELGHWFAAFALLGFVPAFLGIPLHRADQTAFVVLDAGDAISTGRSYGKQWAVPIYAGNSSARAMGESLGTAIENAYGSLIAARTAAWQDESVEAAPASPPAVPRVVTALELVAAGDMARASAEYELVFRESKHKRQDVRYLLLAARHAAQANACDRAAQLLAEYVVTAVPVLDGDYATAFEMVRERQPWSCGSARRRPDENTAADHSDDEREGLETPNAARDESPGVASEGGSMAPAGDVPPDHRDDARGMTPS